jgi:hypothetical protein
VREATPGRPPYIQRLALDGFQEMRRRGGAITTYPVFDDSLAERYCAATEAVLAGRQPEGWAADATLEAFADGVRAGAERIGVECAAPTWTVQAEAPGSTEKAS